MLLVYGDKERLCVFVGVYFEKIHWLFVKFSADLWDSLSLYKTNRKLKKEFSVPLC